MTSSEAPQAIGNLGDYTLVWAESAESAATELTVARRLMGTADGLILASPRMNDADITTLFSDKPVVVINREVEGVPCVIPEVRKGISEAVRSIAANGHKKLAFVAGPAQSWMSAQRWVGVQEACEWTGIEAIRLESTEPTVDGGRQVARHVLSSGSSAVMTYSDLLAIGLLQEFQAAGLEVPDQISIVGFDDIFGADFTTPPLTTVRSPLEECGEAAAVRLLDLLGGNGEPAGILRVETKLVLHGSGGRLLPAVAVILATG